MSAVEVLNQLSEYITHILLYTIQFTLVESDHDRRKKFQD